MDMRIRLSGAIGLIEKMIDGEDYETCEAAPLNEVESGDEGLGFDAIDEETPGEVSGEEDAEARAFAVLLLHGASEKKSEHEKEENFVELDGVAADAVAEIDGPGERGGFAVGVVGEAGEEAADAADGDADAEGQGEEIAGAAADAGEAFDEFDADPAAEESADDGFASRCNEECEQLMGVPGCEDGGELFGDAEEAAADECSD